MIESKYKWSVKSHHKIAQDEAKKLKLNPLQHQYLSALEFTSEDVKQLFERIEYDPDDMYGMKEIVNRIQTAIDEQVPIMIYGDYDADGVTSTTILYKTLTHLGALVEYVIPNRFEHGYGPNVTLFQELIDSGVELIITVDNGIAGFEAIDYAMSQGIDVIVTDHHEVQDKLPNTPFILHQDHPEGDYGDKHLAGVGVTFKLCCALCPTMKEALLPYVAIGTISDLVPLKHENRTLVKEGLNALNQSMPVAIKALLNKAQYQGDVTETTVGFIIGPRLNAVGRLDDATLAVELLLCEDMPSAIAIAEEVERFNVDRKNIVQSIAEDAIQCAKVIDQPIIILSEEGWHEGVLGIVASRVVESVNKPVILLNYDSEKKHYKGSGRSIEGINLFELMMNVRPQLKSFGGHSMACGVTIEASNYDEVVQLIEDRAKQLEILDVKPELTYHGEVETHHLTNKNIDELNAFAPFGIGFEKPKFALRHVSMNSIKAIGTDQKHLKLQTTDGLDIIAFNLGHYTNWLTTHDDVDIIGEVDINEWNNIKKPQLMLKDLKVDHLQVIDERSQANFEPVKERHVALVGDSYDVKYESTDLDGIEVLYLMKLPQSIDQFKSLVESFKGHRIVLKYHAQADVYYRGLPTKEECKSLFIALKQIKQVNIVEHGVSLSEHLSMNPFKVKDILNMFFEVNFVTIEHDVVTLNSNIEGKTDLFNTTVYESLRSQYDIERHFILSSSQEIKLMIENLMRK